MFAIPEAFAEASLARAEASRAWLERLPALARQYCNQWQLSLDGSPKHGYLGLVLPVRRAKQVLALKLTWPETAIPEALALKTWGGNGAAKLIDAQPEHGVLLLERLNSHRSLETLDLTDAIAIAGTLYQRLAVAPPAGLLWQDAFVDQLVLNLAQYQKSGYFFPAQWLDKACALALELRIPEQPRLVNYDLHYGNILAGTREPWLAIDPKVINGDKEFGIAQLLWNRFEPGEDLSERLEILIDIAQLDAAKTRAWTFIRCVDYCLWGLSVGLTEDPLRCQVILEWLERSPLHSHSDNR